MGLELFNPPQDPSILLVDDNPQNLDVLIKELEGFNISVALSGEDAIELAPKIRPDLILMDVILPGIDGFETCRRLKAGDQTAGIPVIFMTVLQDTKHKLTGFRAGGVDYITKPPQHDEVLARINAHITIQSQQRALAEKNSALEESNRLINSQAAELEKLAMTDPLTSLANRRHFFITAEKEHLRCSRADGIYSIVLCDIDHFKLINDTYGHACGDHVLVELTGRMKAELRDQDHFARWGGEEFVILLPGSDKAAAVRVADKLRELSASSVFAYEGHEINVTLTMGVAVCEKGMSLEDCIRTADDRLYAGKDAGRNTTVSE